VAATAQGAYGWNGQTARAQHGHAYGWPAKTVSGTNPNGYG
jgi:hypothetical protein